MAPAAALANMRTAAGRFWTPKITANAAAPAPAANVNSHVGAGGACEITPIASFAAAGASWPALKSSSKRVAEATRFMTTPVGSAATTEISLASPSWA